MKKYLFILLVITANTVQTQNHFNGTWIEVSGERTKMTLIIYTTSNGQFIDVDEYDYNYTEKIIDPWFGESYINKLLTIGGKRRKVYIVQIDNRSILFDNKKFARIN